MSQTAKHNINVIVKKQKKNRASPKVMPNSTLYSNKMSYHNKIDTSNTVLSPHQKTNDELTDLQKDSNFEIRNNSAIEMYRNISYDLNKKESRSMCMNLAPLDKDREQDELDSLDQNLGPDDHSNDQLKSHSAN